MEAVIDAPEIEAADAEGIGKVLGMRIAADEIEFLLGLGGADRGGVLFDDPLLAAHQMLRHNGPANIEGAILR